MQGASGIPLDDSQIIELYLSRDENAIKQTDVKYRKFLFKLAYNILHDESDCEECINDTHQAVIDKISNESAMYFGKAPECVATLSFDTKEASYALSYVRLSDKNVFLQKYSAGSKCVSFVRYICGCVTDETVTIDLETGEVSYDGSRYSENDISALPDISFDIAKTVADYQLEIPSPPHIDTDGKKLLQLYVSGAYFKKDGNTYGLVTTSWLYMDADDYYVQYQDKVFLLYNTSNGTAYAVTLQELAELLEEEMPDTEYGKPIQIPMC